MPPDADILQGLAKRAARGDREALRGIYERTAARLVGEVIGPIVLERATAEEVLKETFVTVLERPEKLADGDVFGWLAVIARNKALDRRRRRSTESRFAELLTAETEATAPRSADPEAETVAAEARRRSRDEVEAVLARMNARYAEALRLRLLDERPRQECAEALGIKLGNFDVLFFRACKQFRALYVEMYGARGGAPP